MSKTPIRSIEIKSLGTFRITPVRIARMLSKFYYQTDRLKNELEHGCLTEGLKAVRRARIADAEELIALLNQKLMKIDFKGIMEGVKNSIFIKEEVERVAKERSEICKGCSKNSDHQKKFLGYKTLRPDLHCTVCGCDIHLKTRSMSSSCPIGKWEAQLTEEQEYELKIKADEQGQT